MADLPQPRITSSGSRGNVPQYSLESPPPAEHVSFTPELVGTTFGWVKIISPERRYNKSWNRCYVLTCCTGCGAVRWQYLGNLQRGVSRGCQSCSQPAPTYPKWLDRRVTAQKQRCTNPSDPGYLNYGGRGITFDFPSVQAACLWIVRELGIPVNASRQDLDRIDNEKGYAPGNLRWATRKVNNGNRRITRIIEWRPEDWPYSRMVVTRKLREGETREEILDDAWLAVQERRKNWRHIKAWFESTTSSTPDPGIASRYRTCLSTTAATAAASEP